MAWPDLVDVVVRVVYLLAGYGLGRAVTRLRLRRLLAAAWTRGAHRGYRLGYRAGVQSTVPLDACRCEADRGRSS